MKLMELYRDKVMGAISGLDRIRFRGTIRWLASERGLSTFMNHTHILLKDFSGWVSGLTGLVRQSCEDRVDALGIEKRYLMSSGIDKEKLARQIASDLPHTYSYTADYLSYLRCPRQYMIFRRYDFAPSRAQTMFFGSLVHQTIEDIHQHLIAAKRHAGAS